MLSIRGMAKPMGRWNHELLICSLSVAGKITIIVTMFVGRIGPLTLMLAMSGQEIAKRYEYPEESVMIG